MLENPQPDAAHVTAGSLPQAGQRSAGPRRVRRLIASPTTLFTARHLDGRSLAYRRARAIATELAAGFGVEITKVQRQTVERAAVLCAIAEDLATRRLAGQPVPIGELLRAEGVAKRAIKGILAERPSPVQSPAPAAARVLELRRQRWEEAAEAKAAQAAQREASSEQNPTEPPDGREADK
jgi:hypothetical protein